MNTRWISCPLFLVLLLFCAGCPGDDRVVRVLVVGDSWAMSIVADNFDGFPSPDVFNDVLVANGLGRYKARGAVTARGGRSAVWWADHTAEIVSELKAYPSIDVVHLITGGIDFLTLAHDRNLKQMTPAERDALWTDVAEHVQIIVDACLAVRPGIRMAIADYDYLDLPALERFAGANYFYGATVTEFNGWMVELGRKKLEVARKTDRCEYVQNWGLLQYHLGDPPKAVPLPGAAPDYSPYPGGDCTLPMPAGIAPDGIHPNEKAHTLMVQNAVDRYYREWLAPDAG